MIEGNCPQDNAIAELVMIGEGLTETTVQPFYSLGELFKEIEEIKNLDTLGSYTLRFL